MISSTLSIITLSFLAGFQLVNAQTAITAVAAPVVSGVSVSAEFVPLGVFSDGRAVLSEHAAVIGGGILNGVEVIGTNDVQFAGDLTVNGQSQTNALKIKQSCTFAPTASGAQATGLCVADEVNSVVGQGQVVHTTVTFAATRADITTLSVATALPTLGDYVLNPKSNANAFRVTSASVLAGVILGVVKIWF